MSNPTLVSIAVAGHGMGGTILFALSEAGDLYKAVVTYPPLPAKDIVWELVPTMFKVEPAPLAVPSLLLERIDNNQERQATHVCKTCFARWVLYPAGMLPGSVGSWSLISKTAGKCCDNAADFPRTLRKLDHAIFEQCDRCGSSKTTQLHNGSICDDCKHTF